MKKFKPFLMFIFKIYNITYLDLIEKLKYYYIFYFVINISRI